VRRNKKSLFFNILFSLFLKIKRERKKELILTPPHPLPLSSRRGLKEPLQIKFAE